MLLAIGDCLPPASRDGGSPQAARAGSAPKAKSSGLLELRRPDRPRLYFCNDAVSASCAENAPLDAALAAGADPPIFLKCNWPLLARRSARR